VSDVPEPPLAAAAAAGPARAPEGFVVRAIEQVYRGLCAACQSAPASGGRAGTGRARLRS
jgi:hypothetical protein